MLVIVAFELARRLYFLDPRTTDVALGHLVLSITACFLPKVSAYLPCLSCGYQDLSLNRKVRSLDALWLFQLNVVEIAEVATLIHRAEVTQNQQIYRHLSQPSCEQAKSHHHPRRMLLSKCHRLE